MVGCTEEFLGRFPLAVRQRSDDAFDDAVWIYTQTVGVECWDVSQRTVVTASSCMSAWRRTKW